MATVNSIEPNDTFSQANSVTLGDTLTGSLSSSSDWDIFKLTMSAGSVLKLDMSSSKLTNWAYTIQVYDASHKLLGEGALGYFSTASFSVGAQTAGTYYVAVTSNNIYSSLSYSITTSLGTGSAADYETESNETLQTATPVAMDHVISGQFQSSSDVDNFSVTVPSTGILSLDFQSPDNLSYGYYQVSIYDAQGNLVDKKSTGNSLTLLESIGTPGKYTIQVKQTDGISGYDGGNYKFSTHIDSAASLSAKTVLSSTAPISASIGSTTQHDWYKVNLQAGSLYEFSLSGTQSGGGTLASPSLVLCTANGKVLESGTDLPTWSSGKTVYSADPQIAFTAPYSGTYYLRADGQGATGSYTLQEKVDSLQNFIPTLLNTTSNGSHMHWAAAGGASSPTVTFSFLASTADGEVGFRAMTDSQKQAVRDVLALYSTFANIDFKEVSDPSIAQLGYGTSDQHDVSGGVTYYDSVNNSNGALATVNVFINNTANTNGSKADANTLYAGGYGFYTLIHETGHALGLKHPGNYNGLSGSGEAPFIPAAWDNREFSVMSYIDDQNAKVSSQTPALLDVAAIQSLYGARTASTSKTTSFGSAGEFKASVLSNGAQNVLDLSQQTADCVVSLAPGTLSSIGTRTDGTAAHDNLAIPFGYAVKQVIGGTGNDVIIGNGGDDVLMGGGGNDTFIGLDNHGAIYGGSGTDTLQLALNAAQAHLTKLRGNAFFVRDDAGHMALARDVEQVQFTDQTVALTSLQVQDNVDPSLIGIYVAAFRRAPETGGYNYWSQQQAGLGLTKVADTIFSLDVVKAIYPTTMSSQQFVTAIYNNVFNRSPDAGGLDYWVQQLNSKSRGQLVIDMTSAALSVPDGTDGKDFFQGRLDWAQYAVTYQADKKIELSPTHLTDLTNGITADQTTVITLIGSADSGTVI